ncbi:flagellar hook protein FlgE [Acidisphaera rubrifaciens]|uniref:Flagellar hook protein FlgE n=1 Tax=Acidisphaera rubrifaciens HS-AP3 TaxID=1231350 RepID=A0A0D6PBI0_9PROT|nr:flagellar hook protein FlgE [Acidisphaera rubrifaciens]GAN78214.1 flagellar hook protein FlgE [Acidisphaera rubrifaciens HS-AP3]
MSLFSAMNTAISGLTAQAGAFSNISDNVANSQTVGYKRVDTSFQDYLTQSTPQVNDPGSVVARPDYVNNVQGTISQTDNPLNMAIAGQGFFAVSETDGTANGQPTFSSQQYYTRAGDFSMDKNGYLVNSAGQFLNGWSVNPATGVVNQSALVPIQVSQSTYQPQATTSVQLSANLPATASPVTSQLQVYDALGTAHTVNLNWTPTGTNQWSVQVASPDDTSGTADRGTADVSFGGTMADGTTAPAGTPSAIAVDGADPGTITGSTSGANQPATFSFTTNFGSGPQTVTVSLGTFGSSNGTVQYAGTTYTLRGLTQNGVPPGSFSSVTTQTNGDVVVNYNNGQSRTIAQVPVVTFDAPDQLQRQNGQAFTATDASGTPLANNAGSGGAGNLVTSSQETSNVDLATELSQLIVAQQAYSANAKVVTSADTLLQTTLDMKR